MAYVQLTSTCFSEAIGTHGLDRTRYEIALAKTKSAISSLKSGHSDGSLPFLCFPEAHDDIQHLWDIASSYQENFDDVVKNAIEVAKEEGFAINGQRLVITAGVPFGTPGSTNVLRIVNVN